MVSRLSSARFLRAVGHGAGRGFVVALVLLGLGATAAGAHGPCRCLPRDVRPGDAMVTNNVFRAVWNPTRADIYYEQPALIAAHVRRSPRVVLLDRDRGDADKRARLVVPNVRAGRYLVLMYDGSEGGAHYTWDSVTVRGRPAVKDSPSAVVTSGPSAAGGGSAFPMVAVVASVLVLAVVGAAFELRCRRARHREA